MVQARDFPLPTIEIACDHCGRFGRYSKARFVDLVGEETELPQALEQLAQDCPHRAADLDPMRKVCRPYCTQDWWKSGA